MKKAYSYIRFSSAMQARGDSLRRQTDLSKKWAKENGYEIVENMSDMGLSAYKGKHTEGGALGVFLEKIKLGEIEAGSVLLVESLDRLSRQQIIVAMNQLHTIVNAGVDVVTLLDNYHYNKDSINDIGNMMYSLMVMHRAHEESDTKSKRLQESWENKIKNAHKKIVTTKSPHWIRYNNETEQFELIPERTTIIREIFDLSIAGVGRRKIATMLNERKVDTWHNGRVWHESYIFKILHNKNTFGIYIPRSSIKGKESDQEIEGYYPAAISKETFYLAESKRKMRIKKGGRPAKIGFGNVFKTMCKCLDCGGSMRWVNKGQRPKGGQYLTCHTAYSKGDCSSKRLWNYNHIEHAILFAFAESLNVDWYSSLLDDKNQRETEIKRKREAIKAELNEVNKGLENVTEAIASAKAGSIKFLTDKLDTLAEKQRALNALLDEIDSEEKIELINYDKLMQQRLESSLYKLLSATDDDVVFKYKQKIHQSLLAAGAMVIFTEKFNEPPQGAIFIKAKGLVTKPVLIDEIFDGVREATEMNIMRIKLSGTANEIKELEAIANN